MEDDKQIKEQKDKEATEPKNGEIEKQRNETIEKLKQELEACKKQAEEYLNGWKRAKADYINFRNEVEKEKMGLVAFANAELLLKILPIYDDLKRACTYVHFDSPKNQSEIAAVNDKWVEGILNIKKQFEDVFKNLKIEEIKTVGEKFNPEFHEAVSREKQDGVEADIVIKEVSGGYMMNGRTIIPAKVVVSE